MALHTDLPIYRTGVQLLALAHFSDQAHLQRLFAKTGTARQSELVRFVATYVEELR